ncbi:hypothetical protein FGO68_gene15090 [Halteria grandinella]|uniref:Uncharacterized protein n=1 Tax=Halteria grandinella TaxID=5974 RepID=A0A8J8T8M3_HALGN|nr:hypothetical protein FGO68_gene15090 [Halteria grandinella]
MNNQQRSINSTLTRGSANSTRVGSALNYSSSKNLLLQHKIEGITSHLTTLPGTQANSSPVAQSRGNENLPSSRHLSQNLNTLNIPYPVNASFASLAKMPSQKSLTRRSSVHHSTQKAKTASIRNKVEDIENNLMQMKESFDRKHNQSVISDKKVEKQLNQSQKATNLELKQVKQALAKLSDLLLSECESLRDDFSSELSRTTLPVFQRFSQLELSLTQKVNEYANETLQWKLQTDQRMGELKSTVDEEFRRELERQRVCWQSHMTDTRVRNAKVDEDMAQIEKQMQNMGLKGDVVDSMRKTLDLLEQRNHDIERSISDHDVKLAAYYSRYDRLQEEIRLLQQGSGTLIRQELSNAFSSIGGKLEGQVKERVEKLERDYLEFKNQLETEVLHSIDKLQSGGTLGQAVREVDKRFQEVVQGLEKVSNQVLFTERLAYDFRKDLAKNMNEVETQLHKRVDQLARAVLEVGKINRVTTEC